jgi:hypothetical protein
MIAELLAFTLIGLAVGGGAAGLLRELFPVPRPLVIGTGLVSAFVLGSVAHAVMGNGHAVETMPIAAVSSVLLVSLLARPGGIGRHRASTQH